MLAFIDPESRIPANHPLRTIKKFADSALAELSPQFDALYAAAGTGRASIPPERLLKASLLMSLFSVRSERAFCEALDYDLRFRSFLDMDMVEPSFDHSTFTRNRDRMPRGSPRSARSARHAGRRPPSAAADRERWCPSSRSQHASPLCPCARAAWRAFACE